VGVFGFGAGQVCLIGALGVEILIFVLGVLIFSCELIFIFIAYNVNNTFYIFQFF
jgi:hypothetical protein